ncbi:uncharacterized protein BDV17DRAFT_259933 [Aspergillus undulatus]|uniref:uncharacterized protein n=1 Tax=Aspergillus undulatus TaxID=1810928 RepID=UPI003CCCD5B7
MRVGAINLVRSYAHGACGGFVFFFGMLFLARINVWKKEAELGIIGNNFHPLAPECPHTKLGTAMISLLGHMRSDLWIRFQRLTLLLLDLRRDLVEIRSLADPPRSYDPAAQPYAVGTRPSWRVPDRRSCVSISLARPDEFM